VLFWPPVGSLFAAFLGYNPVGELLGPSGALQDPAVNADLLTGKTNFPQLITEPFHSGRTVVFIAAAAVMMLLGAVASPTTWRESGVGGHCLDRMANSLVGLIESALHRSRSPRMSPGARDSNGPAGHF
jgi:hypothetical protein